MEVFFAYFNNAEIKSNKIFTPDIVIYAMLFA